MGATAQMDRKWSALLVKLIRGGRGVRAKRRLRGVMGRPRSRGLEGVRWRNWLDECLDPTGRHLEGFQLLSNGIPRTSLREKKGQDQTKQNKQASK